MAPVWHCWGCGVGRPVATALIRPLAWEPPNAAGGAVKGKKGKKKKKKVQTKEKKN